MSPRPKAPPPTAYQRALRRLGRRDHSVAELRRALLDRGHGPDETEAAIERLRAERYLDDRGFAERFARSRMVHQGLGRARVRQGLVQRGVARTEAEAGIAGALGEVDERAVLDGLARRYWRLHSSVDPVRRLPRLWAFLLRRGFAARLVHERLRTLWPKWRDALEGLSPLEPVELHAGEHE
ncbi:MAG TPA: regulatory protein RecX [Vicinamibacteria bacterium]|nr:regulatory protein RecX [Vicinamibacteria bacterium]